MACGALNSVEGAISLYQKIQQTRQLTKLDTHQFLRAVASALSWLNPNRPEITQDQAKFILKVCQSCDNEHRDLTRSVIGAYATSGQWKAAYDLWNRRKDDPSYNPSDEVFQLALAILNVQDWDKFWRVLRDKSFTGNYNYLRHRVLTKYQHLQGQVFLAYIDFCAKNMISEDNEATYFGMESLFENMHEILYGGDGLVESAIEDFFVKTVPSVLNSAPYIVKRGR